MRAACQTKQQPGDEPLPANLLVVCFKKDLIHPPELVACGNSSYNKKYGSLLKKDAFSIIANIMDENNRWEQLV